MACAPKNLTEDQVRAKALQQEFFGNITTKSTVAEKRAAFIKLRQNFKTIEVEASSLNRYTQKRLVLQEDELVQRYASDSGEFIFSGRITDVNQESFIKAMRSRKAADEINLKPDSILAAETGTAVHDVNQGIMERLIDLDKTGLVNKNMEPEYGYNQKSDTELMNILGISSNNKRLLNNLKLGVKEIFDQILATQKSIDPNGKVSILTEQFIADFTSDIGGTMDLFVMYSDGSVALFDYKTKTPLISKVEWDRLKKEYKLSDENWIPPYMYEGLGRQLGATQEMLRKLLKINKFRQVRGIPIHSRYRMKSKQDIKPGDIYSRELITLSIGTKQDALLEQIPIREVLDNKVLDLAISQLQKVLHNYEIQLEAGRLKADEREKIKSIIANKRTAINKLIVRQDFKGLYDDFSKLVNTYLTEAGELLDIDNKESKDFLTTRRLNEIIDEFTAYKGLLESSNTFLAELNIEGQPVGDYLDNIRELNVKISELLNNLKQKRFLRTITEEDMPALMNMQSIGFMESYFMMGKEFNQKALKMLHEKLSIANSKKLLSVQELEQTISEGILGLQEWARKNNTNLNGAYSKLLGEWNLITKYDKSLFDHIENLRENNDIQGLKKIYTLKEGAEQLYKDRKDDYIKAVKPSERQLRNWEKNNSLNGALLSSKHVRVYYDFDNNVETSKEFITKEFQEISKPENKELLDFWNMWTSQMEKFRDLLEISDYETLPNNFLPWIRASVQDLVSSGMMTAEHAKELAQSWANVKSDDVDFGDDPTSIISKKVDIESGVQKLTVPQFFINPIKNNKGRQDAKLKLRDLGASLIQFGNMAYNYHYLTTVVEPHVEALRDAITMYGQRYHTETGAQQVDKSGRPLNIKGKLTDISKKFEDELKYHLYGKKILDDNKKWAKRLLNLKQFHSDYQLAGAWVTWIGNAAQVFGNTFLESQTSHFFSFKEFSRSVRVATGMAGKEASDLYKQIIYFIEPHSDLVNLKAKNLKATVTQKIFDSDTNYWGFRVAEHGVENLVAYSMFQTYGLHNGKIVRLKDKSTPNGTKSLLELSKLVDGKLVIEGLKDSTDNSKVNVEAFTDMRDRARGVAKMIKGGIDSESQYGAQMYVAGKMFMHYKGWLPGMVAQRLSGLRYNNQTKSMHMGWWRAYAELELNPMEEGLLNYTATQLIPSILKLGLAAVTTPFSIFGLNYKYKASETRARRMFEAYQRKNINDQDIQNMNFKDFVDYQQGRIRALATEIFVMLSLYLTIMGLRRDWDDDGLPDWKSSWSSRTMFRMLNRARRELSFLISYKDWKQTITRSPIPATGVIFDVARALENTINEAGDFVWSREESEKKGKGFMRETPKLFPWYKFVRSLDMLDDEFKKFEI